MVAITEPALGTQSWIQILDVALSSILTIALIYLYTKQANTLSRQADIQEEQEQEISRQADLQEKVVEIQLEQHELQSQQAKMIQSINRPVLAVEFWESDGNRIHLCISNLGGLLASQVGVSVRIDPVNEFDPPDSLPSPTENTIQVLKRKTPVQQAMEGDTTTRNYILSNEIGVEFTQEVQIFPNWTPEINLDMEFETAIGELRSESFETGLLTIHLVYFDTLTESRESRILWCQQISLENDLTLQACLEQTQPENIPMTTYTTETCVPPLNRPSM